MENDWLTKFRSVYRPLLKDGYDEFEIAMSAEKSLHIRLNLARGIDYMQELSSFFKTEAFPGLPGVYKIVSGTDKLTETVSFQTGGFYIMNPSSVIPAYILASLMPGNPLILDVSAAPGGKTCALSDYCRRQGLIVANEISSSRLKSLHFNLEKYGCYNVRTVSFDGSILNRFFHGSFDGILLDAPCSNENKIFRNKTVQKTWGPALVEKMAALQKRLIISAYECLAPGGALVYSTCTLSLEENEHIAAFLLKEKNDAKLLKIEGFSGGGLSGNSEIDGKVARISPAAGGMDGFFIAVFRKDGETHERAFPLRDPLTYKRENFFERYFSRIPEGTKITEEQGRGYLTSASDPFPKMRFRRRGLNVYRLGKNGAEPSCQAVWELGGSSPKNMITRISYGDALKYLKGFDIEKPVEYNQNLLFCSGLPIGFGKITGNDIKNKLDRYFLFGKNIEW